MNTISLDRARTSEWRSAAVPRASTTRIADWRDWEARSPRRHSPSVTRASSVGIRAHDGLSWATTTATHRTAPMVFFW